MSVVIPTHGRRLSVERELRALTHQTLDPQDFEVIVSIDGSEDGTREMVEFFSSVYSCRAVSRPKAGRASACNAGAAEAVGELLVFLDDDMEPETVCLEAHIASHPPGSRVGVMGAVPIPTDSSSPPVVRYVATKFNAHLAWLEKPGSQISLRGFYSGNFSIRRDIFHEVGGFDEAFRIYGNEDGELAARLLRAGVSLVYSAQARTRQHYEKDFVELARDEVAKGKTAVLSVRKNPETLGGVRLAGYRGVSRIWWIVRAGLLATTRLFPRLPERVVDLVRWLERRNSSRLATCYPLALDYFFWLGAVSALSDDPELRRRVFARGHLGGAS